MQSLNDHRESSEMEAKASSEAQLRHLLENQPEAAFEVDTNGKCGVLRRWTMCLIKLPTIYIYIFKYGYCHRALTNAL